MTTLSTFRQICTNNYFLKQYLFIMIFIDFKSQSISKNNTKQFMMHNISTKSLLYFEKLQTTCVTLTYFYIFN